LSGRDAVFVVGRLKVESFFDAAELLRHFDDMIEPEHGNVLVDRMARHLDAQKDSLRSTAPTSCSQRRLRRWDRGV
jgi:hypothetical protein